MSSPEPTAVHFPGGEGYPDLRARVVDAVAQLRATYDRRTVVAVTHGGVVRAVLIARRRILAEAQEHLRDSAARHRAAGLSPETAEAAAVSDFGPLETVAHRLAAAGAIRETRISALVALAAVAFFVFPLYVVPENTLPPASWAEKPRDIFILQLVSVALWLLAGALATASAALAWTRWSHLAGPVLVAASAAVAASCAAAAALTARWFALTPATPNWPLAGALAAACLLACVAAAGRAQTHRRLLIHD